MRIHYAAPAVTPMATTKRQQMLESTREWIDRRAALRQENDRLEAEAQALRNFINALTRLMDALNVPAAEAEVLTLFETVLDNAVEAIGAATGSLLIPDDSTDELVFAIVRGESPVDKLVGRRVPARKGVGSWVLRHRQAVIVNNAPADDRFYPGVDLEVHYETRSILAAPLIGGGKVIGVVEMLNKKNGKLFSMHNQTLLSVMCRFAGELLHGIVRDEDLTASFKLPKK